MRRNGDHLYRSLMLDRLGWLDHGFGSRRSEDWLEGRPVATLRQTHSAQVIESCGRTGRLGDGDALIVREPGVWVSVRTADCYPVIVADSKQRVVAVVHAGWRGAAAGIVPGAIRQLGSRPQDLVIAVGPGIGGCCYEVGPEVAQQFQEWVPDAAQTRMLDLLKVLAAQLASAGVDQEQVDLAGLCTCCSPPEFHSYRRDGCAAGRMVTGAMLR